MDAAVENGALFVFTCVIVFQVSLRVQTWLLDKLHGAADTKHVSPAAETPSGPKAK